MIHHSAAFGLAGGALGFASGSVVAAFLHQSLAGLISACQRLMPFGQREATRLLWKLKPAIVRTAERSELCTVDDVASFTPLLDWGAMEHPALAYAAIYQLTVWHRRKKPCPPLDSARVWLGALTRRSFLGLSADRRAAPRC